jgi:hypothetical protein
LHKVKAQINEDKLEEFEAWFASELAGRKDSYTIESFEPDPTSYGVRYSVSFKIARQADVDALNGYLAALQTAFASERS